MAESHREEIAKLEALYASNPGGRVFVHLAEAYRKAGELERARGILAEGLGRHADSASGFVVLGRVLSDLGEAPAAADAFRRVLELDAGNLVALRGLGDMARSAGRLDEAVEHYRELIARNPSNEEVRALLTETERQAEQGLPEAADASSPAGAAPAEAGIDTPPAVHPAAEAPAWMPLEPEPAEQPITPHAAAPGTTGSAEPAEPVFAAASAAEMAELAMVPDVDEVTEAEEPAESPESAATDQHDSAAADGLAETAGALPGDLATFAGLEEERTGAPEAAAVTDDLEAVSLAADEPEVDLQALLDAAVADTAIDMPPAAESAAEPFDAEVLSTDAETPSLDLTALEMQAERDLSEAAGGSAAEFEGGLDAGAEPLPVTGYDDAPATAGPAPYEPAGGEPLGLSGYEEATGPGADLTFDAGQPAPEEADEAEAMTDGWPAEFPELTLATGEEDLAEPPEPVWGGGVGGDAHADVPQSPFSLWLGDEADAESVSELAAELPEPDAAVEHDEASAPPGAWEQGEQERGPADTPFDFDLDTVELGEAVQWEEGEPAPAEPGAPLEEVAAAGPWAADAPLEAAEAPPTGRAEAGPVATAPGEERSERGLETETMADLYLRQGFHERAAEVYRALLRRRPDDERLLARLAEAEARSSREGAQEDEAGEAWLKGAPWAGSPSAGAGEAPYVWAEPALAESEPEDAGTPIGSYLQALAGWRPGGAGASSVDESTPAAAAAPEDAVEMAEPGAEPWAAGPEAHGEPWAAEATEQAGAAAEVTDAAAGAAAEAATEPQAAADEWQGPSQPGAPVPAEQDGEEDDEDLAMFRSWLQSLKK